MARWLIIAGILLVVLGVLWPWLTKLGLGRLPRDIVIERGNVRVYIPLMPSLLASVALSLLLWWFNR